MNPEDQRTSCPGFMDDYGIWNNGFECPPLSGQIRVCCGSDSRRYCCTLENRHEKTSLLTNETNLSFIKKIHLTFLSLPILLTCILVIILLLLLLFMIILCLYCRYHKQNKNQQNKHLSTKQTLRVDHFPFSPPHHQLFFNDNNQQIKDTLTTSTSSSSARFPSDIYYNDWKEFFITTEQPMNIYPTISSHNNDITNQHSYYLFHDKHQQDDTMV